MIRPGVMAWLWHQEVIHMHSFLSEDELQAIENRVAAARPRPWKSFVEGRDHSSGSSFIMVGEGEHRGEDIELTGTTIADQDFIAAARQDVPRLVAEIRELRHLLDARKA
jgi:hypothetical protein